MLHHTVRRIAISAALEDWYNNSCKFCIFITSYRAIIN